MASARPCNGAPIETPASRDPIRSGSTCRSLSTRSITTKRSTWRPAEQSALAFVVDQASDRTAQTIQAPSAGGRWKFLRPTTARCWRSSGGIEDETILVIANLSRFPQHVELDLAEVKGLTPVEIFGRAEFPPVGDSALSMTLGALSFYWFSLEAQDWPSRIDRTCRRLRPGCR